MGQNPEKCEKVPAFKNGDNVYIKTMPGMYKVRDVRTRIEVQLEGGSWWFDSKSIAHGTPETMEELAAAQ